MESISLKLTNKLLRKIKIPNEGTLIIHDKGEPKLKVKVSCTGRKTWSFETKFRKEGIKIKIGVFPDLSIKEARKIARELKTLMAKGIDPREVRRQQYIEENEMRKRKAQKITLEELHNKYIEEYGKIYTINWQSNAARIYNYGKPLYSKKISKIQRNDIEQIFNDITKEKKYATANRFLVTLSSIFKIRQ
ncbi:Arm DNA-binding domain-containing protein [Orientia tsutsugamushi]|uniref:Arm DNA-binding domain-containing protein n=1 Tax=Orientia tsutsugamushi TaxID=784 RepID=UPI0002F86D11|nr:Arm DNA-binding domain-containing protein [Orientia tsutsugamushi]